MKCASLCVCVCVCVCEYIYIYIYIYIYNVIQDMFSENIFTSKLILC